MTSCFLSFRFLSSTRSDLSRLTSCKDGSQPPYFPAFQKHKRWKSGRLTFKNVTLRVHSNCSWRGQGNRGRSWCVPLILEQRLHRFHDSKDKRQFLISLAETKLNSPRNFPNFRSHRNDSRHCVLGFSTPIATS